MAITPSNIQSPLTLVFLHEGLGCIEMWRDFPETLCELTGCTGLVYDRKGYGGSDWFEGTWPMDYLFTESRVYLPSVLTQCGVKEPLLIGHSDGGSIALMAAAGNPAIRGIITEAAHIFVEDITLEGIRKTVRSYRVSNLKAKLSRWHGNNTDAVFFRWADTWLSPEFRQWNIEPLLLDISCPALILQGEQDEYGTKAQVDGIVQRVSGSVGKMIPDCRHVPHFQATDQILTEIIGFITLNFLGAN